MRCNRFVSRVCPFVAAVTVLAVAPAPLLAYVQHNLVSSGQIAADHTDPNLINPWGIVFNPGGFWWAADNGTGVSTLYDNNGVPQSLVVTIPPPPGSTDTAAPTGIVVNTSNDFVVTEGARSGAARFIFCTEDGTISGWNQNAASTRAIIAVDNSAQNAIYKGLALAATPSGNRLFVADFRNNRIDVFGPTFQPVSLGVTAFADPTLTVGFAPFNIAEIDGNLFVAFAKQDSSGVDELAGPGNGLVDEFDVNGVLIRRFATGGTLNAPWPIVKATANFGQFSNDILIGNFGDGRIGAFDPTTGTFLGQLLDSNNTPIEIDGLWGLSFGTGSVANDLYFVAGPIEETQGLFGKITVAGTPPPSTNRCGLGSFGAATMTLFGLLGLRMISARRRR